MANNLINDMKERIKNSGGSKKEIIFFAPDSPRRIRFIQELDTGFEFIFHSDFNQKIYELCTDPEDHEDCKLCKDEIGIKSVFAWSVWDYDTNSVKVMAIKASGISPIPALIEMYEEYGTIMDRDYKIKKVGKGMGGSFSVTPLDKSKFRDKAKPYTRKQIEDIFKKAYKSTDVDEDDEEEEDERPVNKKKKGKSLKDTFLAMSFDEVKEVALSLGITKKEIREFDDDVEELVEEIFDNYEEEDIQDIYDDMKEEEDED